MKNHGLGARLRYAFDKSMAAGTIALIGWLALVALVLVSVAAALVAIAGVEPTGEEPLDFVEAFWASLMRTLDPGTMGDDQGWDFRLVMLAVTLTGVSIVAVLIGLITTGIEGKLDQLRKGRSLVLEEDHTIIFNWSEAIFEIVSQLATANESRFRPRIVIMADRDKVEMEEEIAAKVPKLRNSKVICRTGDPTDLYDIHIVNPQESRSIIILSPETDDPDPSVIKTILSLVSDPERRDAPYRIAAEIREGDNAEIARVVGGGEVQLVLADDLISRIVVQSTRQPGLSSVYTELLDFEGCEIYAVPQPGIEGTSFGEALLNFETCSLIGLCDGDGQVILNPPMERAIAADDKLLLIAEDDELIEAVAPPEDSAPVSLPPTKTAAREPERTLLFGWNRLAPMITKELSRYMAPGSLLTVAASDTDRIAQEIAGLKLSSSNLEIDVKRVDTSRRPQIEALDPVSYDHVMVLGYSERMAPQAADTRTLVTLLHLRAIRDAADESMNIVSEVLDVRNVELAELTRVDDFVVSSKLVSLMLAQSSENESLEGIFKDLLDERGSEIYLKPACDYVPLDREISFHDVVRASAMRGEVAIGHHLTGSGGGDDRRRAGVAVNPVSSETMTYVDGDRIIVIARN
ncbi:MAG: CASTOR/POLLUX-related putative ion channel [Sphingomicrobium sp.]